MQATDYALALFAGFLFGAGLVLMLRGLPPRMRRNKPRKPMASWPDDSQPHFEQE